ncbi:MAG: DUF3617 family protein [Betaproteobacteria bacterium]|nr:DUF3617 family protein [Betaproteobacteria bacterium]
MRKILAIAVPFAIVMAQSALAASPMKPGLWEVTAVVEKPAVLQKINTTSRYCYTADDVKNSQKLIPLQHEVGMKCEIKEYKLAGETATWKESCADKTSSLSGTGSMTMKADTYTYAAALEQKSLDPKAADKPYKVTEKLSGKHIGDCK